MKIILWAVPLCVALSACTAPPPLTTQTPASLSASQLQWLGGQIFRNECNSQPACLTSWNADEEFPSLGIGHFIWYRQGQEAIYQETFPALLAHLQQSGVMLPAWLNADLDQPWPSREVFLAEQQSPRMQQLRQLLTDTQAQQTGFIVERFNRIMAEGFVGVTPADNLQLRRKMQAMVRTAPSQGLYALIDYVHFKGEGTNVNERYQGQGWGLVQVLQQMPDDGERPLQAFVASAKDVLSQRVANAPADRREDRWLQGWHNRVSTYESSRPR